MEALPRRLQPEQPAKKPRWRQKKSTGKSGSQTNSVGWLTQSKRQPSMATCTLCNKELRYKSSGFSSILWVVVSLVPRRCVDFLSRMRVISQLLNSTLSGLVPPPVVSLVDPRNKVCVHLPHALMGPAASGPDRPIRAVQDTY